MAYDVLRLPPRIVLGKEGENKYTTISIDVSEWALDGATYGIVYERSDGTCYPVDVESGDDGIITWTPTATDLIAGYGKLEVRMYKDDVIAKSVVTATYVSDSLNAGDEPSEEVPDWAQKIIDAYVQISPATTEKLGLVKVDGTTITADEDGTIHGVEGDYEKLSNLPSINGTTLKGNVDLPTDEDVEQAITAKGYTTMAEVEAKGYTTLTAVEAKGYQTATDVSKTVATATKDMATQTWVNGKGYQTASDVEKAIMSKGYVTDTDVESKGYQTEADVESILEGKSYATESEVSAVDSKVDTNTENIATNTASITQNAKDIDHLYKLTQGQIWDFEDVVESGVQDAPSGAKYESVLDARGKTEQTTYNGYQLLNQLLQNEIDTDYTNNGITFHSTANNEIHVSGTPTASAWSMPTAQAQAKAVLFAKGTYIVTVVSTDSEYTKLYLHLSTDKTTWAVSQCKNGSTFTLSEDTYIGARVVISANSGTYNETVKFMLESGSTAHDYEPYVGGIASPNPDYPQEIAGVTELNFNVNGTVTTITPPFTLHKVGDYADKLVYENKKWVWEQNTQTISPTFKQMYSVTEGTMFRTDNVGGVRVEHTIVSNCFLGVTSSKRANGKCYYNVNTDKIDALDNDITSIADFNTFIQNNNVVFITAIAPISTDASTEVSDFMDTLQGIDVTNITVTDQNGDDVSYLVEYIVKLSDTATTTSTASTESEE